MYNVKFRKDETCLQLKMKHIETLKIFRKHIYVCVALNNFIPYKVMDSLYQWYSYVTTFISLFTRYIMDGVYEVIIVRMWGIICKDIIYKASRIIVGSVSQMVHLTEPNLWCLINDAAIKLYTDAWLKAPSFPPSFSQVGEESV